MVGTSRGTRRPVRRARERKTPRHRRHGADMPTRTSADLFVSPAQAARCAGPSAGGLVPHGLWARRQPAVSGFTENSRGSPVVDKIGSLRRQAPPLGPDWLGERDTTEQLRSLRRLRPFSGFSRIWLNPARMPAFLGAQGHWARQPVQQPAPRPARPPPRHRSSMPGHASQAVQSPLTDSGTTGPDRLDARSPPAAAAGPATPTSEQSHDPHSCREAPGSSLAGIGRNRYDGPPTLLA
jgi:hypothetical protein